MRVRSSSLEQGMSQLAEQQPGTWILVDCGPAGTHPAKAARFCAPVANMSAYTIIDNMGMGFPPIWCRQYNVL
jgi:hypothetical protein